MGLEVALAAGLAAAAQLGSTVGAPLLLTGATIGIGAAGAAATFGLGNIAVGLAIAGAQYALSRSLTPSRRAINDPGTTGNIRQAVPVQRIIYGSDVQVGGDIFFLDDSKPPYLYMGVLLSKRRISAFKAVHINGADVTFDSSGSCLTDPYTDKLFASFRDGDPDQAIDPLIHADFPNISTDFRQRGIATAVFKFKYGGTREQFEALWGQVAVPNPLVLVDGATIYDPRDPTQDIDDEETWKFSDNASLIQADWVRQPYGVAADIDKAEWDKIIEAANFDDELVALKVGGSENLRTGKLFEKRHVISGVVTLDQSPRDVMEAMLTANRGQLIFSRGKWWVSSSRPLPISITINDGMVVGASSFRKEKPLTDLVNRVRTRFVAAGRDNQQVDGPILDRTDLQTDDGQLLQQTVNLPFTPGSARPQRLAKQYLLETRLGAALNERVSLKALGLNVRTSVLRDSLSYPQRNGIYVPNGIAFTDDFSAMDIALVEYDPTIPYQWNAETDEQDFTLPDLDVS